MFLIINAYSEIPRLLRSLLGALRPSGTLFLKLRNTQDVISYLTMMGRSYPLEEFATAITLVQFNQILQLLQVDSCNIFNIPHQMDVQSQEVLRTALQNSGLANDVSSAFNSLMTKEYAYCITKQG